MIMLEFIQLLKQGYQTTLNQTGGQNGFAQYARLIEQLVLAEAFIRKGQWLSYAPQRPLHIAVVGPTQAGKSSLTNILLNNPIAAGISPLAGYTQHSQGFCHGLSKQDCSDLQRYFGRFQQVDSEQLSNTRHDCYSLTESLTYSELLPPCVFWDTPDFDSIDSATYREGLLRTLALADILVLVVSKEKYADQTVWDLMGLLQDLHQPTLICLNKLTDGSEQLLINSLKNKWQTYRTDPLPDIVPLHYQKNTGLPLWPEKSQSLLKKLSKQIQHQKQARYEQALVQKYWQSWLHPVLAEHQAMADWQKIVSELIDEALTQYRRDYLNHPQHYETFQQALAELMVLLELPGLAGFLNGARKVLTWPVRQLMKLGKKRLHLVDTSQEILILGQIAEHTLIQLADRVIEQSDQNRNSDWWKACNSQLRQQRPLMMQNFNRAAKDYHLNFQHEVENAAEHLYSKLQEQPLLLNSLRATRISADAAAIAITLHTGGIGLHDLLIAPAMLAVSSLLTESAIGNHLRRIQQTLKREQYNTVKQQLFIPALTKPLNDLPEQLPHLAHFKISPAQLQTAQTKLTEKRHGLRIL